MIIFYQYLRGYHVEDKADFFLVSPKGNTSKNKFKLQGGFQLNIRKNFRNSLSVEESASEGSRVSSIGGP